MTGREYAQLCFSKDARLPAAGARIPNASTARRRQGLYELFARAAAGVLTPARTAPFGGKNTFTV